MFEVALKPLLLMLTAFGLILLNALWVAAEFAIVRVRRTRLEELAGQGVEAANDAIIIVDRVRIRGLVLNLDFRSEPDDGRLP